MSGVNVLLCIIPTQKPIEKMTTYATQREAVPPGQPLITLYRKVHSDNIPIFELLEKEWLAGRKKAGRENTFFLGHSSIQIDAVVADTPIIVDLLACCCNNTPIALRRC